VRARLARGSVRLVGPPRRTRGLSRRRLARYARRLLGALGEGDAELSLALVDDAEGAELNGRWRGRAGPTDVLAFALREGAHRRHRGALLGDVVIAVGVARRQAAERGHALEAECRRLLIHGVLHLLGYDHARRYEARTMRAKERALWRRLAD
jgi:rRNA maturation RNase YbeY